MNTVSELMMYDVFSGYRDRVRSVGYGLLIQATVFTVLVVGRIDVSELLTAQQLLIFFGITVGTTIVFTDPGSRVYWKTTEYMMYPMALFFLIYVTGVGLEFSGVLTHEASIALITLNGVFIMGGVIIEVIRRPITPVSNDTTRQSKLEEY